MHPLFSNVVWKGMCRAHNLIKKSKHKQREVELHRSYLKVHVLLSKDRNNWWDLRIILRSEAQITVIFYFTFTQTHQYYDCIWIILAHDSSPDLPKLWESNIAQMINLSCKQRDTGHHRIPIKIEKDLTAKVSSVNQPFRKVSNQVKIS